MRMLPAQDIDVGRLEQVALPLADGRPMTLWVHSPPGARVGPPVLHVHGIQSHPGWFVRSADWLARRGRCVVQMTRRGSGDDRRPRGHCDAPLQLFDDLDRVAAWSADRFGDDGLDVVGVSWGGKLAAAWFQHHHRAKREGALVLVAPGIRPRVGVGAGTKLAIAAALVCCPRRRFDIPLSDPALFTDHEPMRHYLENDPCRLKQATARFLYTSRRLDRMLAKGPDGALAGRKVTLLLADRDRIIDNAATEAVVRRLAGDALVVRTLAGAHTLDFEPDPADYHYALEQALTPEPQKPVSRQ